MQLQTERLAIRRITTKDSSFLLKLFNDENFIRNIADRGVRDLASAEKYIQEKFLPSYEINNFGSYVVTLKESGTSIGVCGLHRRQSYPDIDIGFAFLTQYFGQGYGYEAAARIRDHAKDDVKLKRLVGFTLPENLGSVKVLQKIGMKLEGKVTLPEFHGENLLFSMNL